MLTAAAKASVDMASANKAVEAKFMGVVLRPGEPKARRRCPTSRRGDMPMVSPTQTVTSATACEMQSVLTQALPQKNASRLLPKGTVRIDAPALTEGGVLAFLPLPESAGP